MTQVVITDAQFKKNLQIYFCCVTALVIAIYTVLSSAPPLPADQCQNVSVYNLAFGNKKEVIVGLWKCTRGYVYEHHSFFLVGYLTVYISLKSVAIPGGMPLSFVGGALMPIWEAQLLVTCGEVFGGLACFSLSYFIGRPLVYRIAPDRMVSFGEKVDANRDNLFWYVLFLRLTPLLPNWFVNVSSPIVGIPVSYFVLSTFIGIQVATYLSVSLGKTLQTLGEENFDISAGLSSIVIMMLLQFVALLPVMFKKRLQKYEEEQTRKKMS